MHFPRLSQHPKLPLCIRTTLFPSLPNSILRSAPGCNKTLKNTLHHQMTSPPSHVRRTRAGVIPFPACSKVSKVSKWRGPETTLDAQNTQKTHRPSGRASPRQDPPAPAHARGTFSILGKESHSMFQNDALAKLGLNRQQCSPHATCHLHGDGLPPSDVSPVPTMVPSLTCTHEAGRVASSGFCA